MASEKERRERRFIAPMLMVLFVLALGVAAWFVVLNPDKIAENLPEKGQPTVSPR